jgi:hypothetical protein
MNVWQVARQKRKLSTAGRLDPDQISQATEWHDVFGPVLAAPRQAAAPRKQGRVSKAAAQSVK